MQTIKSFLLSLAVLLVWNAAAQTQKLPVFIADSLDHYVTQSLKSWNIPGVAVGIVKDGQVVWCKGYGIKEIGTENLVDENTLFMIGSNTKAFTGTAMAMLEYDKKCSLEDKVTKWVPCFKMHDPWVTQHANLIDIMSHRLGFETFQGDFMYFDTDLSDAEMLEKIGTVEPMYDFRTKWGYCNAGFFVAGQAIKSISGEPWNAYLQEHIFTPLQMNHTFTKVAEIQNDANASKPHSFIDFQLQEIPYGGLDLLGPAASMSSGVADLNHWTLALLDSGRYEGQNVIPQKVINRTREPESIIGNGRHMYSYPKI